MLGLEEEELKEFSNEYKEVNRFMGELNKVNADPKFREYMSAEEDNRKIEDTMKRFWKEEAMKEGREEGIKEGREEGSYNKTIEIAKKMKDNGYSIEEISKLLSLSISEIEKL